MSKVIKCLIFKELMLRNNNIEIILYTNKQSIIVAVSFNVLDAYNITLEFV